jgi:uncharacterized repeat protein (TIGR01451 family)
MRRKTVDTGRSFNHNYILFALRKQTGGQTKLTTTAGERISSVEDCMKVINCFVLSIFLFIAGCGNFEWFPADKTANFPVLTKAFAPTSPIIGSPVTLTFTITNASGNPTQSGLGFTDTLPAGTANSSIGMFVASPSVPTYGYGGSIATSGTTSVGDTVLTYSGGTIGAGPATCTVTVQVTSNASTTNLTAAQGQAFINGFNNMSNVSSNLNNTVSNQLLAFSPMNNTALINGNNVTIQARDLVVSLNNGTLQFSLLVDNISNTNSANVTVTVTGYDSSGATVTTETVQATPVTLAANATGITLTLTGVPVNSAILTWRITGITITAP